MNYFELYGIPFSFLPDKDAIRKKYLLLSKQYHPDFYSLDSAAKQEEILYLSTLNNKAFKTLSSFYATMKYILTEKGYLEEEEKYSLPQDFLMEMLDLNESVEEAGNDHEKNLTLATELNGIEASLLDAIMPVLEKYDEKSTLPDDYNKIKEYYFKQKYLLRIRGQIDKFAGLK